MYLFPIRMLTGKNCDDINDIIEAAKEIHRNGVEIVAVSLGADGSLAVSDEGIFRAEVPKIDAVNTVGCGDSMIAGFAIGLKEGLSLPETLKKAGTAQRRPCPSLHTEGAGTKRIFPLCGRRTKPQQRAKTRRRRFVHVQKAGQMRILPSPVCSIFFYCSQ